MEVSFISCSRFLVQLIFSAEARHAPLSILEVKICGSLPPFPPCLQSVRRDGIIF